MPLGTQAVVFVGGVDVRIWRIGDGTISRY